MNRSTPMSRNAGSDAETIVRAGEIARRERMIRRARSAADLATLFVAAFAAAVVVDALVAAAPMGRAVLFTGLLVVTAAGARRFILQRKSPDLAGATRLAAQHCGVDDARAGVGVEFALTPRSGDSLSDALRGRAIEQGLSVLRALDPATAFDTRPLRRAIGRFAIVLVAIAAGVMLAPGAAGRGALRVMFPVGDHPSWSATEPRVNVEPRRPIVGDDALVRITTANGAGGPITLVIEHFDGGETRLPAVRAHGPEREHEWSALLRDVRGPMRIRAQHLSSRSRWIRIVPEPQPRVVRAVIEITPPEYTQRAPVTVALDARELEAGASSSALVGSRVRLIAWLTMDARARAEGADAASSNGRMIEAEWTLSAPGAHRLMLDAVTPRGDRLAEPISVVIEAHADEAPAVQIVGGGVRDGSAAWIDVIARDDVGLASLNVERRNNIGDGWSAMGTAGGLSGREWAGSVEFSADELGLSRGGRMFIRFVARDGRPDEFGGPNVTIAGPIEIVAGDSAAGAGGVVIDHPGAMVFGESSGDLAGESAGDAAAGAGSHASDAQPMSGAERVEGREAPTRRDGGGSGGTLGEARGAGATEASDGRVAGGDAGAAVVTESWEMPIGERRSLFARRGGSAMGSAVEPALLNRLSGRHRDVAARYFELLASRLRDAGRSDEETP